MCSSDLFLIGSRFRSSALICSVRLSSVLFWVDVAFKVSVTVGFRFILMFPEMFTSWLYVSFEIGRASCRERV